MKKKSAQCTRQGKANSNIKHFLNNLSENDLHFDDNQISQCVFLGVLRLKPVPSIFSSNKVPSKVVDNKSKRFRNNNSTKEINKNISAKREINKVISGKIRKKNSDKIKASVKKIALKKPAIKIKFNMNKNKNDTVGIVQDSLPKLTPHTLFQNRTITLNPINTAPAFNPVQNLFDKLKQQMDEKYNRPSTSEAINQELFVTGVNIDHQKASRKPKKSAKKKPYFERLSMPLLPHFSSDNGYFSSTSSTNTQTQENEIIVISEENEEENSSTDDEVLINSGPMPDFIFDTEKEDNSCILIDDSPTCNTPNKEIVDEARNIRSSPRINKNISNNQEKSPESNIINLEEINTHSNELQLSSDTSKNSTEKPRKRRTLLPTIPLDYFNTPMLLRSELAQKKGTSSGNSGGESRSSTRTSISKVQKSDNKQEKVQTKPKRDKLEMKARSTENLIYEVVKSSTAVTEHNSSENGGGTQDDVVLVENSPPKVEPLIIKLKLSQNKSEKSQQNESKKSQKSEVTKVTKNLFFPRLLRSDINQQKTNKDEKSSKSSTNVVASSSSETTSAIAEKNLGKVPRKEVPTNSDIQNVPKRISILPFAREKSWEKVSSNTKKTEKSPESIRRQLRSDIAQEKTINIDDDQETNEVIIISNNSKPTPEKLKFKKSDSEIIEIDANTTNQEIVKISNVVPDQTKPRQVRTGLVQKKIAEKEIINLEETHLDHEKLSTETISESATSRPLRSNQAQKKSTETDINEVNKTMAVEKKIEEEHNSESTPSKKTKSNQVQKKTDSETTEIQKNSPNEEKLEKRASLDSTPSRQLRSTQAQKKPADLEMAGIEKIILNPEKTLKKDKITDAQVSKQSKPNQKKSVGLEIIDIDNSAPIQKVEVHKIQEKPEVSLRNQTPEKTPKKITDAQVSKQSKPNQKKSVASEIIIVDKIEEKSEVSPRNQTPEKTPKKITDTQVSKQFKPNQKKSVASEIINVDKIEEKPEVSPRNQTSEKTLKKVTDAQVSKQSKPNQKKSVSSEIINVDKIEKKSEVSPRNQTPEKTPKKITDVQVSKRSKPNQKKSVASEIINVDQIEEKSEVSPRNQTSEKTPKKVTDAQVSKQSKPNQKKSVSSEIINVDKIEEMPEVSPRNQNPEKTQKKITGTQVSKQSKPNQKKSVASEIINVDKIEEMPEVSPRNQNPEKTPKKVTDAQLPKQSKPNQKKSVASEIINVDKIEEKSEVSPRNQNPEKTSKNITDAQVSKQSKPNQKKSVSSEIINVDKIEKKSEVSPRNQTPEKTPKKDKVTDVQVSKQYKANQKKSVASETINIDNSAPVQKNEVDKIPEKPEVSSISQGTDTITVAKFYPPKEISKPKEKQSKTEATRKKPSEHVARRSLRSDVSVNSNAEDKVDQLACAAKFDTPQSDGGVEDASKKNVGKSKSIVEAETSGRRQLRSDLTQKEEMARSKEDKAVSAEPVTKPQIVSDEQKKPKDDTVKNIYRNLEIDLIDYADLSIDTATPRRLRSDVVQKNSDEADLNKENSTDSSKTKIASDQPQIEKNPEIILGSENNNVDKSLNKPEEVKIELDAENKNNNTIIIEEPKTKTSSKSKVSKKAEKLKKAITKPRASRSVENVPKTEKIRKPTSRSVSKTKSQPEKLIPNVENIATEIKVQENNSKAPEVKTKKTNKKTERSGKKSGKPTLKITSKIKNIKPAKKLAKKSTKSDEKQLLPKTVENKDEVIKIEDDASVQIASKQKSLKRKASTESLNINKTKKNIKKTNIGLLGKITKRNNKIEPSKKKLDGQNKTEKTLRSKVPDVFSVSNASKNAEAKDVKTNSKEASTDPKNKVPMKKQLNLDEIVVVSAKKKKKLKDVPLRTLRSSFAPVEVKEEAQEVKPDAVVEKVVVLIHSEPKPKHIESVIEKIPKEAKKKNTSKPRVLRSQNFNVIESINEIKEVPPKEMKKKKNQKETKKPGVSQKSKTITKNKKVEVAQKLKSSTKTNKPKNEKLKTKKEKVENKKTIKATGQSKLQKSTKTSKKALLRQVKSKLKTSKTNPLKKREVKKKPAPQKKTRSNWQNNEIIEKIIEELKNTIFNKDSIENKLEKEQNKSKKQDAKTVDTPKKLTPRKSKKRGTFLKKTFLLKSSAKKKKFILARRKLWQEKAALQRKLRMARKAEAEANVSGGSESKENNPPLEENLLTPIKEETTVVLVNSYLEEVVVNDVNKAAVASAKKPESKPEEDKPEAGKSNSIIIIDDVVVNSDEKNLKRKNKEPLEELKKKQFKYTVFNESSTSFARSSASQKTIDLTGRESKCKDISVFDFDESEPERVPLRVSSVSNKSIATPSKTTSETQTQTTPVKQIVPSSEKKPSPQPGLIEKISEAIRCVSAQTDNDIFARKEPLIPTEMAKTSDKLLEDNKIRDTSDILEELLKELHAKALLEKQAAKEKKKAKAINTKAKVMWSYIGNSEPIVIEESSSSIFDKEVKEIKDDITENVDKNFQSGESSLEDKKSPLKQATIIEMFSKAWKKQEKVTVVKNLGTQDNMFMPPPRPQFVSTGCQTLPKPGDNMFAPSPKRDRPEDDDSDTESRPEWIPEEYAEYKFKYSAQKMMHQSKRIFTCKICQLPVGSYYKLLKHRKEHEKQDRPHVCPQCGSEYKDVEDFSAHLRIHKGKHPYMCLKCDMGFWTKKAYEAHMPVHVFKKTKQPDKKFRCDICAKEFGKLCDVERHTRVHTGEKPCICNICNKGFQQAHNLSKHLLTHLHIKPFVCEICNKQFGRNDVLRRHLLTHSVDKPVKCPTCHKGFIRHVQLLQHLRRKHPDEPIEELTRRYAEMSEEENDEKETDYKFIMDVQKELDKSARNKKTVDTK